MRMKWSSHLLCAIAVVISTPFVLPGAASAGTPVSVLGPGRVVEASPVIAQGSRTIPADGRLRGADFTAVVTAVAWPQEIASAAGSELVAHAGDRLVVFTLALTQRAEDAGVLGGPTAVNASLEVGPSQVPVSLDKINPEIQGGASGTALTTGIDSFAAAVPAHQRHVDLVLTEGSFSQVFDLWTLARVPPAPAVLYRDASSASVASVAGSVSGALHLSFTNPADGFSSSDDPDVASSALTWFAPDGSGTSPSKTSQAFLVVNLQSAFPAVPYGQPGWGHFFSSFDPLPATMLTFTPNGGSPVPAMTAPLTTSAGEAVNDDGLFDALYWFNVPATTTTGTLSVAASTVTGTEFTGFEGSGGSVPLTVAAPSSTTLTFPAASPLAIQHTPAWVHAPLPQTGTEAALGAGSTPGSHPNGGGFPIWLAALLLVIVAGSVVVVQRRFARRGVVSTPLPVEVPTPVAGALVGKPVTTTGAQDEAPPVVAPSTSVPPAPTAAVPPGPVPISAPMLGVLGSITFDSYRVVPDPGHRGAVVLAGSRGCALA